MPKKIMIIAGEPSGDLHGASLVAALKKLRPDISFFGVGGKKMSEAGVRLVFDIEELAFIGFTGVLKNLAKIKKVFFSLLKELDAQSADAVILVDYPGLNLKLAKEIKKRKIPVIYYISPQIWAWWQGRVKTIKRFVDKMIVVFKFEEALYQKAGVDAVFLGHPLLDLAQPKLDRLAFLNRLGLSSQNLTIGLMPGSRKTEVEIILPILIEAARQIKAKLPAVQFALLKAPHLARSIFADRIKGASLFLPFSEDQTYDFLNACDFLLVASGTATLETAIMQKPMIIVYKVSLLNWLIARMLIRLPYIGLVNVVAGKKIVPEFIQFQAQGRLIANQAVEMLCNQATLTKVKEDLQKVREGLGGKGASQRAAELISRCLP